MFAALALIAVGSGLNGCTASDPPVSPLRTAPATSAGPPSPASDGTQASALPAPDAATACAGFTTALLGGRPTAEPSSAPVLRAALFATAAYATSLRAAPEAGPQWQTWRAQGVTTLSITLERLTGREVPPDGSPYVAYIARRTPLPARARQAEQRWDVLCQTTRQGAGWLVERVDLQPHFDLAVK